MESFDVVIYRSSRRQLERAFKETVEMIRKREIKAIIDRNRLYINIGDNRISFWLGDPCRMGGLRPKYYNSNSRLASDFLQQGASKVNGYEIPDLETIVIKCMI